MPLRIRTQKPPKYLDYTRYKPFLRVEFQHECIYCEVREPELGGTQSFCADHYRPQSKFPNLENDYSNLLYSCRYCNQWKGNYWPSSIQKLARFIVLNPFIHLIENHLDKITFAWRGKTIQGKWNVDKFRLSSPARIRQRMDRENIRATISILQRNRDKATAGLAIAQKRQNREAISQFQNELNSLDAQINTLYRQIEGPKD
jgi:hypothetical protein